MSLRNIAIGDLNEDGRLDAAVSMAAFLGKGDGTFQLPINAPPLALLDANGDGHLDYISITGTDSEPKLAIHPGQGDATFGPEIVSRAPFAPGRIEIADFNGDDFTDLALVEALTSTEVHRPSRIALLIGDGTGTFRMVGEPLRGSAFALADLNGDGKTDLARVAESRALQSLLSKDDGTFEEPLVYGQIYPPSLVALADFDQDGNVDLILVNATVAVLRGNGSGTFQGLLSTVPHMGISAMSVMIEDWNGDGRPDVIVHPHPARGSMPSLTVYLNKGAGRLQNAMQTDLGLYATDSMQLGDLNGDGVLDVIASNETASSLSVALGRPDGTVRSAIVLSNLVLSSMAAADLSGDGVPDLAGVAGGRLLILAGKGTGEFTPATASGVNTSMGGLVLADFTGDGAADLAAVSQNGVAILANRGRFRFEQVSTLPSARSPFQYGSLAKDLNGDGRIDLVTNSARGPLAWINQGSGQFAAPVSLGLTGGSFAAGDLNADGNWDLVISEASGFNSNSGALLLLAGNGDGTFRGAVHIGTGSGVAVGDFNGDGKADIATVSLSTNPVASASIAVYAGNGDGTFQPPAQRSIGRMSSSRWAALASADLNADGTDDVIWGCYNQIALLPGQRGAGLAEPVFLGASKDVEQLVLADFDKDGRPDLAMAPGAGFASSGGVAILLNKPSN